MKNSALERCFALGIVAFVAMVSVSARGADYTLASDSEALSEGGASGGDIIRRLVNDDGTIEYVHIFTNTEADATFTIPENSPIVGKAMRLLAVGGGASGGSNCGGGGGAGALLIDDAWAFAAGEYTITVGRGGTARTDASPQGERGGDTSISNRTMQVVLQGGGGGGTWDASIGRGGLEGGSGGGGSSAPGNGAGSTQYSTYGYGLGNAGGGGRSGPDIGGGGGGAGSPGADATAAAAGNGGAGITSDITGEEEVYAAGGGGGVALAAAQIGYGGGDASGAWGNGGDYNYLPTPGKPATGGGGGGGAGGGGAPTHDSAAGGSGVVVIRYAIPMAFGDDVISGKAGDESYYRFGTNGSFRVAGLVKARVLAVGGGGAGANPGILGAAAGGAGGGGAGGMIDGTYYFKSGLYDVVVGSGGVATGVITTPAQGADGAPSFIVYGDGVTTNVFAYGGGGGGVAGSVALSTGRKGGSGGGGSLFSGTAYSGGAALQLDGYGNAGGSGSAGGVGGGGGGAGGPGSDASSSSAGGAGGEGRVSDITGIPLYYAAGGGGGAQSNSSTSQAGGIGGSEIGGNGAGGSSSSHTSAKQGTIGTGSGGGGGRFMERGGSGGSGIVVIRIEAVRTAPMVKPAGGNIGSVTYTGVEQSIYTDYDPVFQDIEGDISATDKGTYTFTVSPKPGLVWSDGTSDAVTCTWSIASSALSVKTFAMPSWQKGEATPHPYVESTPALDPSQIRFEYKPEVGGSWTEWTGEENLAVGSYSMRMIVFTSPNYTIPSAWPPASGGRRYTTAAKFEVFEYNDDFGFPDYLGYHTVYTVAAPTIGGEVLTNFPMLVRVSEATMPGIYRTTRSDLGDIRFTLPGQPNTLLPYEIDTWNPGGESLVWVRVPEYSEGAQVIMNWGEVVTNVAGSQVSVKIPDNPAVSVWGDYAGVWHFAEDITASDAATTLSADSTANGYDAVPYRVNVTGKSGNLSVMVSGEGPFGNARVNGEYRGNVNSIYTMLRVADFDNSSLVESAFTFSGWFSMTEAAGDMTLISTRGDTAATAAGWELKMANRNNRRNLTLYGYGNNYVDAVVFDRNVNKAGFVYVSVVFDGDKASVYANGTNTGYHAVTDINLPNAPTASTGLALGGSLGDSNRTILGLFDEFRIRHSAITEAWADAEYAQSTNCCAISGIYVTKGATFLNRWLREPSASQTAITMGTAIDVDPGDSVYDTANVVWHFTNLEGEDMGQDSTTLPAGTYTIDFRVDSGASGNSAWTGLETQIVITVREVQGRPRLGNALEVTQNGRVLLANDDSNSTQPVEGQSYYLTSDAATETFPMYWVHEDVSDERPYPNLYEATVSTLSSITPVEELCGTHEIWHLDNIRIGNTYSYKEDGTIDLRDSQNYLPQSRSALPISGKEDAAAGDASESAWLVMRNIPNAAIYSPCYTNGIGSIYFDAVNGSTNHFVFADGEDVGAESFRLVVEVCTNTVKGLIPSDENAHAISDYDGDGAFTTNRFSLVDEQWHAVPMTAIKIVNGIVTRTIKTDELSLDIETGARRDGFYRVIVKQEDLGIRCPARFRIRRSGINVNSVGDPDAQYLLLVDNVEVSPPASRVDFSPYGNFDSTKGGSAVTGWSGAFDPAFPAVSSPEIYGRMKADFYANYLADSSDGGTNLLQSAALFYRWRYLEQSSDPANDTWKIANLSVEEGFRTEKPLDVSSRVGDIEFWTVAIMSAPYYIYYDYSGLGIETPGYTEDIGIVTNRCSDAAVHSRTLGTDWFVRLRDGGSEWEKMAVTIIGIDGTTNTYWTTLADENTWRYYFKTPTNETGTVKFRIEGHNRQVNGSREWTTNTVLFAIDPSSVGDLSDPNRQGILSATYSEKKDFLDSDWFSIPVDAKTGYLLFQVEDSANSITIVHADYQNFNEWSDAKTSGVFIGSFSEEEGGPASGTSIDKKSVVSAFENWRNMPATTNLWKESFTTTTGVSLDFFTTQTTLNGWTANQSRYIYEQFNSGDQYSLQMRGEGLGSIQYVTSGSTQPRGIDTLSFTTRLATSTEWEDFSYSDYDGMTALTNVTFIAGVKAITNSTDTLSGAYSLSLVSHYRPTKGCYEVRYVRYNASNGCLQLWKWAKVGRSIQGFFIGEGNWSDLGPSHLLTSSNMSKWGKMLISVENMEDGKVKVIGAMNGKPAGVPDYGGSDTADTAEYCVVEFIDDGTIGGAPLPKGTVGIGSANCPARFCAPRYYKQTITLPEGMTTGTGSTDNFKAYGTRPRLFESFPTTTMQLSVREPVNDDDGKLYDYDDWALAPGRVKVLNGNDVDNAYSMLSTASSQTLGIFLAKGGSTAFGDTPVTNVVVSSFLSEQKSLILRHPDDCSLQIRVIEQDNPSEVVIDNIEFSQWRGDDWRNLTSDIIPGKRAMTANDFAYTNYTFTTCWVTNKTVLMSARRTSTNSLCSIVSPLMDGWDYGDYKAGTGLGQISFRFKDAQTNACVLVQVLTNSASVRQGNAYSEAWEKDGNWITLTNYTFEAESEGLRSFYIGMRGVHGLVRLAVPSELVEQVAESDDPTAFGDIYIQSVTVRDEPDIDFRAWWGWNIRTLGDNADSERRMFISDISDPDGGLSLAVNNTTTQDVDENDLASYKRHLPFVQSPTFGTNLVGGVTFKARKYNYTEEESPNYLALNENPAYITIYGSFDGDEFGKWYWLKDFEITGTEFASFKYTSSSSESFKAFRFVIRDVPGVNETEANIYDNSAAAGRQKWSSGKTPVRVILDEIAVTEAIRPRVGFHYVGAFRSDMNGTERVPNVPCEQEQPLCKEGWGVQCEIYKAQLPEMIDLDSADNPPEVVLHWFEGKSPWGYDNWKANSSARSVVLRRVEPTDDSEASKYVFRSTYQPNKYGSQSVVTESEVPGTVVQYMLEVRYNQYNDAGEIFVATNFMTAADWQNPDWYRPIDLNMENRPSFAAYTILDTIAPHWAWINEVNIFGAYIDYANTEEQCQFVEIAAPQGSDLTNWYVQMLALEGTDIITNVCAVFGYNGLPATKSNNLLSGADKKAGMSFRVIGSPTSQESVEGGQLKYSDGSLDGVWTFDGNTSVYGRGEISPFYPIAVQLVRPNGILESEIVAAGTNYYARWETDYAKQFYPENFTTNLNHQIGSSHFIYIGTDDNTMDDIFTNSLSVVTNVGGSYACWTNTTYSCWTNGVARTPGHINIGQVIEGEPPTAGGMNRIIFCSVLGPHIRQWDDDLQIFTTNDVALYVQRNVNTNILYEVDDWQAVREVSWLAASSNEAHSVPGVKMPGVANQWYASVGTNIDEGITVTAFAEAGDELLKYLSPESRYYDAICNWLAAGKNIYGEPWEASEELYLAEFRDLRDAYQGTLSLEQMYWLDIPPTTSNMWLKGGLWDFHLQPRSGLASYPDETLNNYVFGIEMIITNANPASTFTRNAKRGWSPYVIQGVKSGTTTWNYVGSNSLDAVSAAGDSQLKVWGSATLNVMGKKLNDITRFDDSKYWIALEKFVINEDSFDENHRSQVEILDVNSEYSPAYWEFKLLEDGQFADESTTQDSALTAPFFRWTLKDQLSTSMPLLLAPTNTMENL